MSAAMDMGVLKARDHAGDCFAAMVAAGFDGFEFDIPYDADRPYKILLWELDGLWRATVENAEADYITEAEAEGESPAEALWKLAEPLLGGMSWPGEDKLVPEAIPARLIALAAVLHEKAVERVAEEAADTLTKAIDEAGKMRRRYLAACGDRDNLINQLPEGAF